MNIKARERGIHWHSYKKKKKKPSFADDYGQDLILLILRITAWSSLYCVPNIRYHHSSQGPKDIGLFSLLLSVRIREEVWFLSRLDLWQTSRTDRQTDTVLSCFALLYFTDVTCFTNWRQNPSPVKKTATRFVATLALFRAVWNQTHSIFEGCLYFQRRHAGLPSSCSCLYAKHPKQNVHLFVVVFSTSS